MRIGVTPCIVPRTTTDAAGLLGRERELRTVGDLLARARDGDGGSIVLVGPAGQGKSAVLAAACDAAEAAGMLVGRVVGVEVERSLPWAGLTQLGPVLGRAARALLPHQAEVLDAIFGRAVPAEPPDRLAVLLALTDALAAAAAGPGLLVAADDLQWVDEPTLDALAFASRRLAGTPVAVVGARRARPAPASRLAGEVTLEALDRRAATALAIALGAAPPVAERLAAEAAGNPLAVRLAARALSAPQLAGTAPLPAPLPVGDAIEDLFRSQIDRLPDPTRAALLLLAATGATASTPPTWLDADALEPAEEAGLVALGPMPAFTHPLARSAVYWAAGGAERRRAHLRLAELAADPVERAWHRASAVAGPDVEVARELAEAASRARRRGAAASAATAYQRAAELSPDAALARGWLLDAADAAVDGGQLDQARLVLASVDFAGHDEVPWLRARLAAAEGDLAAAVDQVIDGAVTRAAGDRDGTARAVLEVGARCLGAGRFDAVGRLVTAARRLGSNDPLVTTMSAVLDAAVDRSLGGTGAGHDAWRGLLDAEPDDRTVVFCAVAGAVPLAYWRDPAAPGALEVVEQVANARGIVTARPYVHNARSMVRAPVDLPGSAAAARQALDEADALGLATLGEGALLALVTVQGQLGDPGVVATAGRAGYERRAVDDPLSIAPRLGLCCLAMLEGRWDDAIEVLWPLHDWAAGELRTLWLWHADLGEAAARKGDDALARAALDQLRSFDELLPGTWSEGAVGRVEGMLVPAAECDGPFGRSVATFDRLGNAYAAGRSALLWGERLRRARRRAAAREPLHLARERFLRVGASRWAERAERELGATGAPVPATADHGHDAERVLTPQQLEVARLAAAGASYRDIAEHLYVSPRTVEAHLTAIYRRLGVRNRAGLAARALTDPGLRPG